MVEGLYSRERVLQQFGEIHASQLPHPEIRTGQVYEGAVRRRSIEIATVAHKALSPIVQELTGSESLGKFEHQYYYNPWI